MIAIKGKGVFGGIAFGKIHYYNKNDPDIKRVRIDDIQSEINRFEKAKSRSLIELQELYDKALIEVGEANAQIFDIHQMMIEDLDFNNSIINIIETQNVNAEYAVALTSDNFSQMFASMEDEYMRERAADVKDISNRIIKNLQNKQVHDENEEDEKVIICAEDLAPSETVQLDKSKVLAFVTANGSTNSHTAILARTMNIPAIIGAGKYLNETLDGSFAIVDGFTGILYIEPNEEKIQEMLQKQAEDIQKKELLLSLKNKENITKDGQSIQVFANIGGISDVGLALTNDADGIGLFRSEFLYLENSDYPSEEEQFQVYKTVLENMAGKKVIIRTLDIGADKQIDYFKLDKEENPALGFRAIRICLSRKEVFMAQLRALYRASVYGKLSIMFPMIISKEEILAIKQICNEVKQELDVIQIPYSDDIELGIMIETPASVMVSDELAQEVDFFSVGTNDLTQYTLAMDRQNPKLDNLYDPHHKGLLRMIKIAADQAHKYGKWIGICGELGADLSLTELFLAMDIDELSVSPSQVLLLRNQIRNTDLFGKREALLADYTLG